MQEGIAMAVDCHSHTKIDGQTGIAIKQLSEGRGQNVERNARAIYSTSATWQLALAESLFALLLLATHRSYRKRLTKTRVAWSVNLEEFRNMVDAMLAEWTGMFWFVTSPNSVGLILPSCRHEPTRMASFISL